MTPYTNRPPYFQLPPSSNPPKDDSAGKPKGGDSKGTDSDLVAFSFHESTFLNANHMTSFNLVNCTISLIQVVGQKRSIGVKDLDIHVEALLDSGSLAGNFISSNTLSNLGVFVNTSVDGLRLPICSGLDNVCTNVSNVVYKLSISLMSENLTKSDFNSNLFTFFADVKVLLNTPLCLDHRKTHY